MTKNDFTLFETDHIQVDCYPGGYRVQCGNTIVFIGDGRGSQPSGLDSVTISDARVLNRTLITFNPNGR
jgi:hypothetical protein